MNKQEFTAGFEKHLQSMLETMKRKNHDYSGGDKESSPFRNFELVEAAGIATREQAILVRISDKLSRANTLLNSQALVLDESFQDTCLDAANYFIILALAYKDMEDTVHKSISSLIDTDIIGNLKRMKKDDEERQKKDVLDATGRNPDGIYELHGTEFVEVEINFKKRNFTHPETLYRIQDGKFERTYIGSKWTNAGQKSVLSDLTRMKNDNDNKDRLIKEGKYQICILNKKDEFEFFEVNKNSTKEEIFRIIEKSLPIAQRKELNKYFNEKPVKKG